MKLKYTMSKKKAMRRVLYFALLLVFVACGKELTPVEQAQQAAREYYDHLLSGRYDQWVSARVGMDSIPDDYRQQLEASAAQFMQQQKAMHEGLQSIEVMRAQPDTSLNLMLVFLQFQYGDSTREEIVVPMVETTTGTWKIR